MTTPSKEPAPSTREDPYEDVEEPEKIWGPEYGHDWQSGHEYNNVSQYGYNRGGSAELKLSHAILFALVIGFLLWLGH